MQPWGLQKLNPYRTLGELWLINFPIFVEQIAKSSTTNGEAQYPYIAWNDQDCFKCNCQLPGLLSKNVGREWELLRRGPLSVTNLMHSEPKWTGTSIQLKVCATWTWSPPKVILASPSSDQQNDFRLEFLAKAKMESLRKNMAKISCAAEVSVEFEMSPRLAAKCILVKDWRGQNSLRKLFKKVNNVILGWDEGTVFYNMKILILYSLSLTFVVQRLYRITRELFGKSETFEVCTGYLWLSCLSTNWNKAKFKKNSHVRRKNRGI